MTQIARLAYDNSDLSQLPNSIQSLIASLSSTSQMTSKQVSQCLMEASVNAADLQSWATFDRAVTDSYGRKLVYNGGYFEIMVMSWLPGDVSAIHDHGQTQWGAVQCFGRGIHTVYCLNDGVLSTKLEESLLPSQIINVSHSLIHQMSNYSQERFFSLHVYGCNDKQDIITGNARIFDLLEGKVQYTNGGVFFCLPESEIVRRGEDLKADRLTTLKHHRQMRDRILAIISNIPSNCDRNLDYWQSKLALVEDKIQQRSTTISLVG